MKLLINKFLFAVILTTLCPFTYAQQMWKMKAVQMQSRWAKDVNPEHPYDVYPRPQMERDNWINLNGLWDYSISKRGALPSKFENKILVPFPIESALSGVKKSLLPNEVLWYKRNFNRPNLKPDNRLLLHFGAVDYHATILVNKKEVGKHSGGYTAFSFDITEYVKDGQNELIVKVSDPTNQGVGPHGKQVLNPVNIYYTPSSGIWQTVWIEVVPASYIRALKITPDIDKETMTVKVTAPKGFEIIATAIDSGRIITSAKGLPDSNITLPIKNPKLWSPQTPFLYDLKIQLVKSGATFDEIKSYFGMRKINIQKDKNGFDRIFLNNKYTYNLGTLDQGFWPAGLYTAPTDDALAFDIVTIKAMGFNTIRKHIKIEPARWYYYADKLGMMVWQDFVNPNQSLPKGAKEAFEKETKETMDQLYNFPCIIAWVLFNERWGAYDQQRLTEWVKAYDPSRLVNGHSGELLYTNNNLREPSESPYISSDMTDVHSYPNPMNAPAIPGKVRVLGEFGGIGVSVPNHEWNDLQGWGYIQVTPSELELQYKRMINKLKELEEDGLSASIYTQPFDVEGEENGLMTYDREIIKVPINHLRKFHQIFIPQLTLLDSSTIEKIAQNIDADDTDARYHELVAKFEKGERDSTFLRRLALMAIRQKDQLRATQIGNTFFSRLKQPYSKENLQFLLHISHTSNDKGFKMCLADSQRINEIMGPQTAEKKLNEIIYSEEISPFVNVTDVNPDWDKIQQTVTKKYDKLGKELVLGRRMLYYWTEGKDWENFGKYYKEYFEIAMTHSQYHINNASWAIFLHITDRKILEFAAKVAKYNFQNIDPSPEAADTYANLLHKLGRTSEAIKWQERAVDLSKNAKVHLDALAKMKAGKPTWKSNSH